MACLSRRLCHVYRINFKQTYKLPSIPEVAVDLIVQFNDPKVDADEISANIQKDQLVVARVLGLANSARYVAGRQINSIDSGGVRLGFDIFKTLTVASSVAFSISEISGFDLTAFCRDSIPG